MREREGGRLGERGREAGFKTYSDLIDLNMIPTWTIDLIYFKTSKRRSSLESLNCWAIQGHSFIYNKIQNI